MPPYITCVLCHQNAYMASARVARKTKPSYWKGVERQYTRVVWSCKHKHATPGEADLCMHLRWRHPNQPPLESTV